MAGPRSALIPKTLELGLTPSSETCEKYFLAEWPQEATGGGVAVHLCFIPYEAGHVTSVYLLMPEAPARLA